MSAIEHFQYLTYLFLIVSVEETTCIYKALFRQKLVSVQRNIRLSNWCSLKTETDGAYGTGYFKVSVLSDEVDVGKTVNIIK